MKSEDDEVVLQSASPAKPVIADYNFPFSRSGSSEKA
jgi:hypothetical protein